MKCPECKQAELKTGRKDHWYRESGLDHVVLRNIEVSQCPHCGMEYVDIPAMAQLHQVIAASLVNQQRVLLPAEISFLRKALGSGEE